MVLEHTFPRTEGAESYDAAKCSNCALLEQSMHPCEPHIALALRDTRERVTRGLGVIRWDTYRCGLCGSQWVRQTDDLGQYWFEP